MELIELFYGKFVPPKSTRTITHKIGFHSIPRYIAPQPRVQKEKGQPKSEKMLIAIMKKLTKPMTPMEICQKTPWTRNHCGMLLCKLFKDGLLKRQKVIIKQSRTFLYSWAGDKDARPSE